MRATPLKHDTSLLLPGMLPLEMLPCTFPGSTQCPPIHATSAARSCGPCKSNNMRTTDEQTWRITDCLLCFGALARKERQAAKIDLAKHELPSSSAHTCTLAGSSQD